MKSSIQLVVVLTILNFAISEFVCCTTETCNKNEKCYKYNNVLYCCTKASCRLYKGKLPENDSFCVNPTDTGLHHITNIKCESDDIRCAITGASPDIFGALYNIPFICNQKADCDRLWSGELDWSFYCCRNQFCRFNWTECRAEDINFKLGEGLANALIGISVALFAINLGVTIMLIYKLKSQKVIIKRETHSVTNVKPNNFDFYIADEDDINAGTNINEALENQKNSYQGMDVSINNSMCVLKPEKCKPINKYEVKNQFEEDFHEEFAGTKSKLKINFEETNEDIHKFKEQVENIDDLDKEDMNNDFNGSIPKEEYIAEPNENNKIDSYAQDVNY